jgi:D-apionolactonase
VERADARPRRRRRPNFDLLWGERSDLAGAASTSIGDWGMVLTGHGLEHLSFRGDVVVPRVFFSVRDQSWRSPAVPMTYGTTSSGTTPGGEIDFRASVEGYPLQVSGSVVGSGPSLTIRFRLEVGADVDVSRAGPCVLHYVLPAGETITTDLPGRRWEVKVDATISSRPITSGYRVLTYSVGLTRLTIQFDGALFEMEDQRNWTDNTFKSYTPPLSDARPLHLHEALAYTIRFSAESSRPRPAPLLPSVVRPTFAVRAPRRATRTCSLPELGLAHPGGSSNPALVSALGELQPAFVHVLADLSDAGWQGRFKADLLTISRLGSRAVVTVDCPPEQRQDLCAVAEISAGVVDTAFLFDRGQSVTSDDLADAARVSFEGTGVRVGAGARGHFASLNRVGRVPEAAEVVGVPLAAAAHDDDRRAVTSGLNSYPQIFRQVRRIAAGRAIYAGPVGFAPTFDSWSPAGLELGVREAWARGHPKDRSVFAAAWTVAVISALGALGVERVCISGAIAPVDDPVRGSNPVLAALQLLRGITGDPVKVWRAGDRISGLSAPGSSVVAVMTDEGPEITGIPGRVLVIPGAKRRTDKPGRTIARALPSPSVLSLTTTGYIELVESGEA